MSRTATSCAIILAVTFGCADAIRGQEASPSAPVAPALRVGPGDLLEVTIYDNPDLTGHFRVDEKGDIVAPLLGAVHVQGDTAEEVGKVLEKRYLDAEILPSDKGYATVFISEYASQGITVSGDVRTPGMIPALGVRMLHDVITAAGGIQPTASSELVITHKDDPAHPVKVEYRPDALSPVIPQIQIFPGDNIAVPKAGMVYLLGNVTRPGAYVLEGRSQITLMKVMAQGSNPGHAASMKNVHLVRTLNGGQREDIAIRYDKVVKGDAADVALKDGDIVYVPTSNLKLATERAITAAIGIGTSVAVYRTAYQ